MLTMEDGDMSVIVRIIVNRVKELGEKDGVIAARRELWSAGKYSKSQIQNGFDIAGYKTGL